MGRRFVGRKRCIADAPPVEEDVYGVLQPLVMHPPRRLQVLGFLGFLEILRLAPGEMLV